MNIHWTRWVIAVLALLLFGWGSGTGDVQAKEKEVIFLALSDYTGPIAGLAVGADMGLADYFKYINDKGGVEGIKLKFIGVDTRYDVARAISAYRKYRRAPGLLVVNGYSTGLGKAIERMATKDGLIVLTPGDGGVCGLGQAYLSLGTMLSRCLCRRRGLDGKGLEEKR